MRNLVRVAFSRFISEKVNINHEFAERARASRNWLIENIKNLEKEEDFPILYSEKNLPFGSFARKTKICELDDIDIMITLSAQGATYCELETGEVTITVLPESKGLKYLCNESLCLNSRKVINIFVKKLANIAQYEKADIARNLEATTLKLKSYSWNFDIVPCFYTMPDSNGEEYYIIPDGKGKWKKTDPRIDRKRTSEINQYLGGNVLNVIRIIKYWNSRPTMPTISSYCLETIVLNYYEKKGICSDHIGIEISNILRYLSQKICYPVLDYKKIQGDLNELSNEEKQKVFHRSKCDFQKAKAALRAEKNNDYTQSINIWKEIFGDEFPSEDDL